MWLARIVDQPSRRTTFIYHGEVLHVKNATWGSRGKADWNLADRRPTNGMEKKPVHWQADRSEVT